MPSTDPARARTKATTEKRTMYLPGNSGRYPQGSRSTAEPADGELAVNPAATVDVLEVGYSKWPLMSAGVSGGWVCCVGVQARVDTTVLFCDSESSDRLGSGGRTADMSGEETCSNWS